MHRQAFDLQLSQYDERGWRATFYTTGMQHSLCGAQLRGGQVAEPRGLAERGLVLSRQRVEAGTEARILYLLGEIFAQSLGHERGRRSVTTSQLWLSPRSSGYVPSAAPILSELVLISVQAPQHLTRPAALAQTISFA